MQRLRSMRFTVVLLTSILLVLSAAIPAAAADRVLYSDSAGLTVRDIRGDTSRLLADRYWDATWSPDGMTIYFVDFTGIWAVPSDGSEDRRPIVTDPDVRSVAISPDGRLLAYDRSSDPDGGIHVVPVDGSQSLREITSPGTDGRDMDPRWAPDGQSIAFRRFDNVLSRVDLRVAAVDFADPLALASERILLDRQSYTTMSAPAWEPDGDHLVIVAVALGDTGDHDLLRVAVDGPDVVQLVRIPGVPLVAPTVSPDGRLVAFGGDGLRTVDIASGEQSLLVATPGPARDPAFTADGGTVVYESYSDDSGCHCNISDLYYTSLQGGGPVQLTSTIIEGPLRLEASPGVAVRVSGPSRVETAVAISREAFDTADVVVLARADVYADALAGAPLAGALQGPILLSQQDNLPAVVEEEIQRLGARRVVLLGDETALSSTVEDQLATLVADRDLDVVDRIGGATRYGTAALVADQLVSTHAYVVQGASADPARGWPDATAVAGLAAAEAAPLLLTEQDRLPAETAAAIEDGNVETVTIVGGTASVSEDVEQQLRALGVTVDRLAGTNRYETSSAIAERSSQRGADSKHVWVATGRNWPDTLAAGPAAAHLGDVLILADGVEPNASAATLGFLDIDRVARARIVGSPNVMSPTTVVAIERRASP